MGWKHDGLTHFDGTDWSVRSDLDAHSFGGLWFESATEICAEGFNEDAIARRLFQWDGSDWQLLAELRGGAPTDLWGSGPTNLWGASATQAMSHWDGVEWTSVDTGVETPCARFEARQPTTSGQSEVRGEVRLGWR